MLNTLFPQPTPEAWAWERQFEIEHALKKINKKFGFSLVDIAAAQARRVILISELGLAVDASTMHANLDSVDAHRASAACLYELFRAQAWVAGVLNPTFPCLDFSQYEVHFEDPTDLIPMGKLSTLKLEAFKEKVATAIANLREQQRNATAVGFIGVRAVDVSRGDLYFQPHCTLAIHADHDKIARSFNAAEEASRRGRGLRYRQAHSRRMRLVALNAALHPSPIVWKMKANRRMRLTGPAYAEWLLWMSRQRMDRMLISGGLLPGLAECFETYPLLLAVHGMMREWRLKPFRESWQGSPHRSY